MLANNCLDKEKTIPTGNGIEIDGAVVRRCRNMIYWYRWGRHTFDIRVVREVLGLQKEHPADKYFMPGSEYTGDADRALTDAVGAISGALNGRTFRAVLKQHDAMIKQKP